MYIHSVALRVYEPVFAHAIKGILFQFDLTV